MTSAKNGERPEPKGKVLTLSNTAADPSDRLQKRRPTRLLVSCLLCVVLPLIAATLYYATLAPDR